MNCQKFESVVSELARGQMMAAELRGEALAHSDACEDCAMRLRDEEMLTRGLHSLAGEMEALEAPAMIEANLLMAFRTRQAVVAAPAVRRYSAYWLAAVAAMLLIAISVFVFRWANRPLSDQRQARRQEEPQQKPQQKPQQVVEPQLANDSTAQDDELLPQRPKPRRMIHPASLRRPASAQVANHVTNEIATDFIPLGYMSAASLQDGGQIVRVQLPRSALANFGFPVNMDRYNEKVKADVLFGVDGTARAIRFVQ